MIVALLHINASVRAKDATKNVWRIIIFIFDQSLLSCRSVLKAWVVEKKWTRFCVSANIDHISLTKNVVSFYRINDFFLIQYLLFIET